jgi:alpha-mannosidase
MSFIKTKPIFHLLPNAHLDPVWFWDWREGLNEGLTTVRTVLELMEEFPELTFIRGESVIYQHIQKTEPAVFQKVLKMIQAGRWDVVGGSIIQPDTNLASTEVLCREFEAGLGYFEKMGVRPRVAWLADSFGHSGGLPNILSAFGMEGFTFTRPQEEQFPLNSPLFWWEGGSKNRILCYRQHSKWYCSERDNLPMILDLTLERAMKSPYVNVGVLFGLGNHGGGPSRRHLAEIEKWKSAHPEVEVRFSTLHHLFDQLKIEAKTAKLPIVRGEFGFCLRGCYSSVQKFKKLYSTSEIRVSDAEVTRSLIGFATDTRVPHLEEAWHALAFNAFHDILPGTSIERAFEDQSAWMGMAIHKADQSKFEALNLLAARVDTSVPPPRHPDRPTDVPFLLWNPLSRPFSGLVELEASMDYRPIYEFKDRSAEVPVVAYDHDGKSLPLQVIQTEHTSMPELPWRKRVVVPMEVPAFGWTFVRLGWREKGSASNVPAAACGGQSESGPFITNGVWSVSIEGQEVSIAKNGVNFFTADQNFRVLVFDDPWGSWGGMNEEKDSFCLDKVREVWKLSQSEILEKGPLRAKLWTRWSGKNSWLDLTFSVSQDVPWVKVEGRLLWNERSARLKLVLPSQGQLRYDVPGGEVVRQVEGHVPGGNWVTRTGPDSEVGFASDALKDFDAVDEELRVTLARATRYANDVPTNATEKLWQPAVDCGELKFQFALFGADIKPDHVVEDLLYAPSVLIPSPKKGTWARSGSLGQIKPHHVRLLSLEQIGDDELRVRVQNRSSKSTPAVIEIDGAQKVQVKLGPQEIQTLSLKRIKNRNGAAKAAKVSSSAEGVHHKNGFVVHR